VIGVGTGYSSFGFDEFVNETGEGDGFWREVEVRNGFEVAASFVNRDGFADAGMADEEDVGVGVDLGEGLEIDFLLTDSGDYGDRSPAAEDSWRREPISSLDE